MLALLAMVLAMLMLSPPRAVAVLILSRLRTSHTPLTSAPMRTRASDKNW
jgi:hypothetical protein